MGDDGSQEAERAGKLAAQLGKLLEASVLLVGVYSIRLASPPVRAQMPHTFDELLNKGEDILKERAARLETMVATGNAAAVIQEIAGESALVAVGSRGLGAVRRFALGSVSTDVLRAVRGPVLLCPPPNGA